MKEKNDDKGRERATSQTTPQKGESGAKIATSEGTRRGEVSRSGSVPSARAAGLMADFGRNPFAFMRRFSEEMDQLFEDFWSGGGQASGGEGRGWAPSVDVERRNGNLVVCADLPGMSREDVNIEVQNDTLVISGERREERQEGEAPYRRTERRYGSFYRAIPLPEGADVEHAAASFRNGVLEITVPMPESSRQSRRIPIEGKE